MRLVAVPIQLVLAIFTLSVVLGSDPEAWPDSVPERTIPSPLSPGTASCLSPAASPPEKRETHFAFINQQVRLRLENRPATFSAPTLISKQPRDEHSLSVSLYISLSELIDKILASRGAKVPSQDPLFSAIKLLQERLGHHVHLSPEEIVKRTGLFWPDCNYEALRVMLGTDPSQRMIRNDILRNTYGHLLSWDVTT